jgi:hypothetical protein
MLIKKILHSKRSSGNHYSEPSVFLRACDGTQHRKTWDRPMSLINDGKINSNIPTAAGIRIQVSKTVIATREYKNGICHKKWKDVDEMC